ncbi:MULTISPECIES: (d)CMP kinase [unclassified Methylophilus]|uniref:(d)CMP kinase n=1 Tax=unclassified Methylophilus TaxID=2630143 RepID=UPI0006FB4926|nr:MULTISPECIES: (d)CMP kinase [unclassified Methylophilus]KQT37384.1 cytidylate kinase [Methylophilus sp. Leaf416]KQT55447.1 cytidylate kinase [Methylophilus sp. Leaf459]
MTEQTIWPVIAIDGPSASGKGSVAELVAKAFGFHYLDSGALYRLLAYAAHTQSVAWSNESALADIAGKMDIRFESGEIYLNGENVSAYIRTEQMGKGASEVAVHPQVRTALLQTQRNFRKSPGLVGDGRDIGSVIFPDAILKVFLTAGVETRAQRRYHQLINRGDRADYDTILDDLKQRDLRDTQRSSAPLIQLPDAMLVDTTKMNIAQAVDLIIEAYKKTTKIT